MGYYKGDVFTDIWGGVKKGAGYIPGFGSAIQKGMQVAEDVWGGIKSLFGGGGPHYSPEELSASAMGGLDLAKRLIEMQRPQTSPGAPIEATAPIVPSTAPPTMAFASTPDSEDEDEEE